MTIQLYHRSSFYAFLLPTLLNFQGSTHLFGVGSFSKYHRKGYAFEALTVLHEYLHKMAPEWEFISYTECENIASIKLLKKLGYKDLGYVPSMDSQAFGKWTTLVTEKN